MKCLIIHGSYRQGNTYKITELVKSYMGKSGNVEFEEIFLSKLNMPFCVGCNQCFLKGEEYCPHSSTISPLARKMALSDALIITTPTYSLQLSALLKCFIDHMSYNLHRPTYFTKKALVIATTAGSGTAPTVKYLKDILYHWGFNYVDILPLRCFSFNYVPDEKTLNQIHKKADLFYKELSSGKLHKPSIKRVFYFNFWRAMAKKGQHNDTKDYRYWKDTNMLHKTFFQSIPLGKLKESWGNLAHRFAIKVLR